jgi:hypothetical protein
MVYGAPAAEPLLEWAAECHEPPAGRRNGRPRWPHRVERAEQPTGRCGATPPRRSAPAVWQSLWLSGGVAERRAGGCGGGRRPRRDREARQTRGPDGRGQAARGHTPAGCRRSACGGRITPASKPPGAAPRTRRDVTRRARLPRLVAGGRRPPASSSWASSGDVGSLVVGRVLEAP